MIKKTFTVAISAILATTWFSACSSSERTTNSAPADDKKTNGTPSDDKKTNGAPAADNADAGLRANDASVSTANYCADEGAVVARCVPDASCSAALVAQCSEREALRSTAFKDAFHACAATILCTESSTEAACVANALATKTPTTVQQKLADDFCAACAGGAKTVHEGGISCEGHVLDTPARGISLTVLSLSDDAAVASAKCIEPAASAYPDDYSDCENAFINCVAAESPARPESCQ